MQLQNELQLKIVPNMYPTTVRVPTHSSANFSSYLSFGIAARSVWAERTGSSSCSNPR